MGQEERTQTPPDEAPDREQDEQATADPPVPEDDPALASASDADAGDLSASGTSQ